MTDYTKTTDFTSKDSLPSGDSGKIIRGAEFGTEFDNIETAVNSKSNIENPVFTGTITGNGSGITNVAAASIDLTVSSDTDADYNVPFMNATGDGGSAKVLQVDDNGLMFNPNSNTLRVNRLKGSNDNLLIQDTSGNTILDIDANALEIPVNTTITGTTAVTGNITVTGTVDGRDVDTDGTKLDTVETNADVTDATNVTAAGALMDSELTDIAAVKALNQGVATTDSPTFAGATVNGTVEFDGLSGTGAVTVTDILDQDNMSSNSATALATQQSIKAYVDSQVATSDTLAEVLANGNTTGGTAISLASSDILGTGNINITGAVTADGLTIDGSSSGVLNNVNFLNTNSSNTATANRIGLGITNSVGPVYTYIEANEDVTDGRPSLNFYTGDTATKRLRITDGGDIEFYEDGGATAKLTWDASDENLEFADNSKAIFGAGSDLQIYHDGTHSVIEDAGTGYLILQSNGTQVSLQSATELYLTAANNGAVTAYHNGSAKFATTSTGIDVTGTTTTDGLTVQTSQGNVSIPTNTSSLNFDRAGSNYIRATDASGSFTFITGANDFATQRMKLVSNGDMALYEDTGTTAKFFWDASTERLGIGNSAPTTALDVSGTVSADGLTVETATGTATPTPSKITVATTSTGSDWSTSNPWGSLAFYSADTSSGGAKEQVTLDAVAYNSAGGVSNFRINTYNGGLKERLRVSYDGDISFYEDTGTTAKFFWDASEESLGIGTSSPSAPLTVQSDTGASTINLVGRASDGYSTLAFRNNADTSTLAALFADEDSDDLQIHVAGDEAMRIDSAGNVGIGTSSPSSALEVAGSAVELSITDSRNGSFTTGDTVASLGFYSDDTSGGSGTTPTLARGAIDVVSENAFGSSHGMVFRTRGDVTTAAAEAMRIDSSQNVLVGGTSTTPWSNGTGTASDNQLVAREDGVIGASSHKATANAGYVGYFNRTSTDGGILAFNKDGSTVGTIGTVGGDAYFEHGGTGIRLWDGNLAITPCGTSGATLDGTRNLGASSARFKDLYLSGGVLLGGTGSANKLDDYEEGTFTPSLTATSLSVTYDQQNGKYTKVGNVVYFAIQIGTDAVSGGSASNTLTITGLPFSAAGQTSTGSLGFTYSTAVDISGTRYTIASSNNYLTLYGGGDTTIFTQTTSDVLATTQNKNRIFIVGFYYTG